MTPPDAKLDAPREYCYVTTDYVDVFSIFLYHQPPGTISGEEILGATMRTFAKRKINPVETRLIEKSAYDALSAQLAESAAQVEQLRKDIEFRKSVIDASFEREKTLKSRLEECEERFQWQKNSAEQALVEYREKLAGCEKDNDEITEERDKFLHSSEGRLHKQKWLEEKLATAEAELAEYKADCSMTHDIERKQIEALDKQNAELLSALAAAEAEKNRLEDLLGSVYETTLEPDTKSRIAANMDATPNGYRTRKSENAELLQWCERLAKSLQAFNPITGETDWAMRRDVLAEFEQWRTKNQDNHTGNKNNEKKNYK